MNTKATLLIVATVLLSHCLTASPEKRALIVAIGNYPSGSGWPALGAAKDGELIRAALLARGFEEKRIAVLEDAQATKAGIFMAIKKELIQGVKAGDVVFFHFSGHGQQIADDDGDEADGYDEAIVPYDSPKDYRAGIYEGEQLIRDEELGSILTEVRQRLGPEGQLLVTIDACHSGTGTRGWGRSRGTGQKMASEAYLNRQKEGSADANAIESAPQGSASWLAPMVAFFASGPNQLNYEIRTPDDFICGSLSYVFSKIFSSLPSTTTYKGLFDQIRVEMSGLVPQQTPQAEGELYRLVLGGSIKNFYPHFQVKHYLGSESVLIDAGTLNEIYPGTSVAFYPIDTHDTTVVAPLARGVVQDADLYLAEVALNRPVSRQQIRNTWVFVTRQNFGDLSIRLGLQLGDPGLEDQWKAALAAYQRIQLVTEQPDLLLRKQENELMLETRQGDQLWEGLSSSDPLPAARVVRQAQAFARARFLRRLNMQDPYLAMTMELLPEQVSDPDGQQTKAELLFRPGDSFRIQVSNRGRSGAYYSILDIQPNDQINLLIPSPFFDDSPADYYLAPGETKVLDVVWDVGPPYGNELLKLIATGEPMSLEGIFRGPSSGEKAADSPLSLLLRELVMEKNMLVRGRATPSIPSGAAHIDSVFFQIVE